MKSRYSLPWGYWGLQRGFVYVCGDAKHMAKDVHRTLANVLQTTFNYSTAEAEAHVKRLGEDGRYQKDVW